MKLYNTITRSVDTFEPREKKVSIYVCGITPYDTTHLGHAFTYSTADILIRYLESRGLEVRYVQNVTDIDDDVLRKASQVGEDWQLLGNRWTAHFIHDMISLNVRPPDDYPRATDVILEIVQATQKLIDAGQAYISGGNVYYSVNAWHEFGKLSHLPRNEMLEIANERGNRPDDPHKQDPLDFVLWQAQAPGEPAWGSPWGPGRPGWHIECSSMASKFLGEVVDIHGGGADLCFPHHECEIAQKEPVAKERPFVRFWMHTAMVRHEGEKMSKSLGNLVMVRDLLQTYSADALRLYLTSYHYRDSWSYDPKKLKWAAGLAEKLRQAALASGSDGPELSSEPAWASFTAAMENDLDTPAALKAVENLGDEILEAGLARRKIDASQQALRSMGTVFGMRLDQRGPEPRVAQGWDEHLKRFVGPVEYP